jgi:hypothetical protein
MYSGGAFLAVSGSSANASCIEPPPRSTVATVSATVRPVASLPSR